ncbi:NUDIX hydrolase [Candidatus Zixiibacteriota bacterium]|nr:NUDIX hydrolase [candidate division Zixibacteria bacterium]
MGKSPRLAADIIIEFPDHEIVLIKRGVEPFKGDWAIPGGGVEIGETVEQAAVREAKEETGLDIKLTGLVGVYSDPGRDPRGHTVSIVYHAIPVGGNMNADTDAAEVIKTADLFKNPLAFDHKNILEDWLKRVSHK